MSPGRYRASLVLIAVTGAALSVVYSRGVPVLQFDSMVYLDFARSLASGHWPPTSFSNIRFGQHPPLFSLVLAPLTRLSDPAGAGYALNQALFFLNILLTAAIARRALGGGAAGAGLAAASFLAFSPPAIKLHSRLISEPLYLTLGLAALLAADLFARTRQRRAFAVAVILAAMTALTRYIGVAFVIAAGSLIAFREHRRRNFWPVIFFLIFSLSSVLFFLVQCEQDGGVGRGLYFQPPPLSFFYQPVVDFLSWLIPGRKPWKIAPAFIFLYLAFTVAADRLRRSGRDFGRAGWSVALCVFVSSTFVFLTAARTFIDPNVIFTGRHLFPAFLAAALLGVVEAARAFRGRETGRNVLRYAFVLFLSMHCMGGIFYAMMGPGSAQGYLGLRARSAVLRTIEIKSGKSRIYTNNPYMFPAEQVGNRVFTVPFKRDRADRKARPEYESELARMRRDLEEGAVLVLFTLEWREFPSASELEKEIGLTLAQQEPDGAIYVITEKNSMLGRT